MIDLLEVVDGAYNKSSKDNFDRFLHRHSSCKRFYISSDYCIGDRSKPNDTISIAVFPDSEPFQHLKERINSAAPKDLKHARHIADTFVEYMHSGDVFVLCFKVVSFKGLTTGKGCHLSPREVAEKGLRGTENMLIEWVRNEPEKNKFYAPALIQVKNAISEIKKKSSNIRIFHELVSISFLVGYVASCILESLEQRSICWLPDRDRIIGKYKDLASEQVNLNINVILRKKGLNPNYSFEYAVPEKSGAAWYDPLVRIADYIAGAVADYNFETKQCSHDKHFKVLNLIVAGNKCIIVYSLDISPARVEIEIIPFAKLSC